MAATAPDDVHRVVSAALDQAFYRAAYPDLARPGFDPVADYLQEGWRQGRDPAPWFSVEGYLSRHRDVAEAGVEPLYHYLTAGRLEAREAPPSERGEAYVFKRPDGSPPPAWTFEPPWGPDADRQQERASEGVVLSRSLAEAADRNAMESDFDVAFYRAAYPDIAAAGVDPLAHYMTVGWREGRDPSGWFSTRDYLEIYPDIAAADLNPFLHYVRAGRAEGRSARSQLGFRYDILARGAPVADRIAAAAEAAARVEPDPPESLRAALAAATTGLTDLHVTFSHDDYSRNIGGLQLCLQREERRAMELGRDHLHFFPAHPWPILRTGEPGALGVVLNGRTVGVFSPSDIADNLRASATARPAGRRSFALHSLLGHSVDEVLAILQALELRAGYFWLHDFASLCAGYHLLRNDVQDCAAPPPESTACQVCAYGPWRRRHLVEHERLFSALELTVVSPAQPTLDLWRAGWTFPHRAALVHPHASLVERAPAAVPDRGPLRVAFAGYPVAHKGWPVFRDLVESLAGDPRYTFLHLGGRPAPGVAAEFHHVEVAEGEALAAPAMQRELERLAVDVVLIWPLCRETFSFAAYEAVAAGCAVITWPDSGNVATMVQRDGRGLVLPDEAALAAAFQTGEVAALARRLRRPMLYDLAFSGLSLDLTEGADA